MKNKIAGSVIILVAIALLIIGNMDFHFDFGKVQFQIDDVVNIPSGNTGNFISNQKYVSIYEEFEDIEYVELNLDRGDLKVVSGDILSIKGDNVLEDSYRITCIDNKLTVDENNSSITLNGNPSFLLTLPTETLKMTANCLAGTVRFNDVAASEIIFNVGKGSLEGSDLVADRLSIDAGMGSVNLHQITAQNHYIKSGMGSVNVDCRVEGTDGGITIDSPMGSVNLKIYNNPADFDFNLAKRSSSVNIDGVKAAGYKYNNTHARKYGLTIGAGVSSVEIHFDMTSADSINK